MHDRTRGMAMIIIQAQGHTEKWGGGREGWSPGLMERDNVEGRASDL